jgi:hypothetical protein
MCLNRKMTNKCVKVLVDLLMYSRFTPTCFSKWLSSSGVVGAVGNHLPKHVVVNLAYMNKSTSSLTHLLIILRYYKTLGPTIYMCLNVKQIPVHSHVFQILTSHISNYCFLTIFLRPLFVSRGIDLITTITFEVMKLKLCSFLNSPFPSPLTGHKFLITPFFRHS